MTRTGTFIAGIFFILAGIMMVSVKYLGVELSISFYWPSIICILGIFFLLLYFALKEHSTAFLLIGVILTLLGLLFQYSIKYGWEQWNYIAPSPLFIVAVAFMLSYILDKKHPKGFYVTSIVTGIISLAVFFILSAVFNETLFLGGALIISGILLPISSLIKKTALK